jgi:protein SCO1/2
MGLKETGIGTLGRVAGGVCVIAALATLASLAGCDVSAPAMSSADTATDSGGEFRGIEPAAAMPMPDVTLRTVDGKPFNLVTSTNHPVTLVFFGYTNCPDVCPLVMSDLTLAYAELPADVREQTQVLFVTTDPARDTGPVLTSYLDRYDPAFVGLTGRVGQITAAATELGVAVTGKKTLPSGGYDVGHGAQVIGFAHENAPVIWTPGTPVAAMVDDIETLAGA